MGQLHSILRGAAAHHVTVAAGSGDNGAVSTAAGATPVKEVSLPAADPLALADQDARHDLGFVNPAIYRIARGARYHQAFHDVTTGENMTLGPVSYAYHAGPGWDPVTGWGSPNAQTLIPLLAHS